MDSGRFDRMTRTVSTVLNRRSLAGALGLAAVAIPSLTEGKKKKKKVKKNQFGCVDVSKFCKNGGQCCSGICDGKKGKKKCKAHDASTCQAGQKQDFCGGVDVECTASGGTPGLCNTTTGNAGHCSGDGTCFNCTKDADCTDICGSGAACIVCSGCPETDGLACVGLADDSCLDLMI
jgi:hypothetical protein